MHFEHFKRKAASVRYSLRAGNWGLESAAKEERMGVINDESRSRNCWLNCGYFFLTQAYRCLQVVSLKLKKGLRGLQILTEAYRDLQTNIA